jgi:hypothetical protein
MNKEKLAKCDYIAMKMMARFKEIRRECPNKPLPDMECMLGLLEVVRDLEINYAKEIG